MTVHLPVLPCLGRPAAFCAERIGTVSWLTSTVAMFLLGLAKVHFQISATLRKTLILTLREREEY